MPFSLAIFFANGLANTLPPVASGGGGGGEAEVIGGGGAGAADEDGGGGGGGGGVVVSAGFSWKQKKINNYKETMTFLTYKLLNNVTMIFLIS